ncbi:MAG: acyl-CoA thioesterase [Comamonadaceae bacterium]|nr:acyl-CoA thioesterase [Burkholderiales bacterium]MEB2348685.1 acyl-CoA thioesterase [Comamonadaceae bacterium]
MRIDIPEAKQLVHEMTTPMRWGDMDAMGHMNNTVYFRYMETARIDWFVSLGYEPDPRGQGVVVVNAFCNFIRQFEYPANILVRTYASNPGKSSFDTWVTMSHAEEPDQPCATGGATIVWVDFPAQKSAPLPERLRRIVGN